MKPSAEFAPAQPAKTTSWFEFMPTWLMYAPVVLLWLILALRYRSLTLPLLANPRLFLGGMVGSGKEEVMQQCQGALAQHMLPWLMIDACHQLQADQLAAIHQQCRQRGFDFPCVCKPDVGCRGAGVKVIHSTSQLADVMQSYPEGTRLVLQKLASFRPEAGIFYVRMPDQPRGHIVSLTLKSSPLVTADGISTLEELVLADPRAGKIPHLYQPRFAARWHSIPAAGEVIELVFAGSHCRGAVFSDGRHCITNELNQKIDRLMHELPEFFYGRLDVKFKDTASLCCGDDLEIVEINGVSSEAVHIWDKNARFTEAIKTLLWQYHTLFIIGNKLRNSGKKPPSLLQFYRAWRMEKALIKQYPLTD